jgi:tryptophan synthase alpha chain
MTTGLQRLSTAFERARTEKRKPLVLYLTANDPDFETSLRVINAAARAGMDILELGVPWSDPSADGLAIQGAMARAIKSGGGLRRTFELCRRIRAENPTLPIVLFGYANPIVVMGIENYAKAAEAAGADGTLCVDWPADDDRELPDALRARSLAFVPLLAPTSTESRMASVLKVASGFVYYVSLTGITGAALTDFSDVGEQVNQIRKLSPAALPVVVGFGIKTPADARAVAQHADAVVVGSAAVRIIETAHAAGRDPAPEMAAFVQSCKAVLG